MAVLLAISMVIGILTLLPQVTTAQVVEVLRVTSMMVWVILGGSIVGMKTPQFHGQLRLLILMAMAT